MYCWNQSVYLPGGIRPLALPVVFVLLIAVCRMAAAESATGSDVRACLDAGDSFALSEAVRAQRALEAESLHVRRTVLEARGVGEAARDKFEAAAARQLARYDRLLGELSVASKMDAVTAAAIERDLEDLGLIAPHQPVNPDQLTFDRPDLAARRPGEGAPELKPDLSPPGAADLAETPDVIFSGRIRELAARLDHDPVRLYNWVRNNVEYLPVYGSLKGADYALLTREGTDCDQASLLIALLRVSGIPARYAWGVMEIPEVSVTAWLDVAKVKAAGDVMVSTGIPVSVVGTELEPALRMERCWVLAWVDADPARGGGGGAGESWVALDPSFKRHELLPPTVVIPPIDVQGFIDTVNESAILDEAKGAVTGVDPNSLATQLRSWAETLAAQVDQQKPDATTRDLIGQRRILPVETNVLPAATAFPVEQLLFTASALPDEMRHRLTIEIGDRSLIGFNAEYSVTRWIPELAGQRLTVTHQVATPADHELLLAFYPSGATGDWRTFPTTFQTAGIDVTSRLCLEGVALANGQARAFGAGRGNARRFRVAEDRQPRAAADVGLHQ